MADRFPQGKGEGWPAGDSAGHRRRHTGARFLADTGGVRSVRLRPRSGFVGDTGLRAAFEADIGEVDALIDSILAYVGEEAAGEPVEAVDVASLLATLAESAEDLGSDVVYRGPARREARLRVLSIRRAVSNLVNNAVHDAGEARLSLAAADGALVIRVDDDGPGVPEAALPRLTEPFHRLDAARARTTAGAGLGLAIVEQATDREGGTLVLANRPGGAFRAEMRLPRR